MDAVLSVVVRLYAGQPLRASGDVDRDASREGVERERPDLAAAAAAAALLPFALKRLRAGGAPEQ